MSANTSSARSALLAFIFPGFCLIGMGGAIVTIWDLFPLDDANAKYTAATWALTTVMTELSQSGQRPAWAIYGAPVVSIALLGSSLFVWLALPKNRRDLVEKSLCAVLLVAALSVWILANDFINGIPGAAFLLTGAFGARWSLAERRRERR